MVATTHIQNAPKVGIQPPTAADTAAVAATTAQQLQESQTRTKKRSGHSSVSDTDAAVNDDEEEDAAAKSDRNLAPSIHDRGESAARRPVAFQPSHAIKFGLEVVARDQAHASGCDGRVTAVLCLFCKHFGREARVGAKRRATTNFKYFKGVFRTDQYLQHHRLQHPTKWAEYDAASVRERQTFFPHYVMAVAPTASAAEGALDGSDGYDTKKKAKKTMRNRESSGKKADNAGRQDNATTYGDEAPDAVVSFDIPTEIVALFLGDQSWQPRALPSCEKRVVSLAQQVEHAPCEPSQDTYNVTISDRVSFQIAVDLCANGLSTRQITRTMRTMAKYFPTASTSALCSIWEDLVDEYVQVATFASVSNIAKLVSNCVGFSLGLHAAANTTEDYVDVRVRFLSHHKLEDLHLATISCVRAPQTTTSSSNSSTSQLVQILDVVCPQWPQSLLGISVAGDLFASAFAVSPWIESVRSRVSQTGDGDKPVMVTWDGHALLVHALRNLFNQLMDGAFAKTCFQLKAFIKSESKLVQEIGHEPGNASSSSNTGGGDEGNVTLTEILATTRWLTDKRVRIRKYLAENEPTSLAMASRPTDSWWLCLALFDWIASLAADTIQKIQDTHTPKDQMERIRGLGSEITVAFRVIPSTSDLSTTTTSTTTTTTTMMLPPPVDVAIPTINHTVQYLGTNQSFAATKTGMLEFIVELGSFVNSLLSTFHDHELDTVLAWLGKSVATLVETLERGLHHAGLCLVHDLQDATAAPPLPPPLLTQELAALTGKEFSTLVAGYHRSLKTRYTEEELDAMDQEHQALKRAMREKEFRADAAPMGRPTTPTAALALFDAAWARTLGRFRLLHAFAGGLATMFPFPRSSDLLNTSSHAPHQSTTPDHRGQTGPALLDLAIEAPRHAAQFQQLHALAATNK